MVVSFPGLTGHSKLPFHDGDKNNYECKGEITERCMSVAPSFNRNNTWWEKRKNSYTNSEDESDFTIDALEEKYSFDAYKLRSVNNLEGGKKKLVFKKETSNNNPNEKKDLEEDKAFKKLMLEVDLSRGQLLKVMRKMFHNVFMVEDMRKFANSPEKLEFITQKHGLICLRHGDKAYRV